MPAVSSIPVTFESLALRAAAPASMSSADHRDIEVGGETLDQPGSLHSANTCRWPVPASPATPSRSDRR